MKIFILIILYICTSFFHVLAKQQKIDNIIAFVNDQIILKSDVDKILVLLKKKDQDFRIPLKSSFLKDKVIQKLIIDSLILQEANRMNIKITQDQINNLIQNIALRKNMSVNDFKNHLFFNDLNNHLSYNNYVNNIKNLLKIRITQDYELKKRVNVSEQEVNFLFKKIIKDNKKFKKINLSYILVPFEKEKFNKITKNKKILAEMIVNKLKKGYDFEKLYQEYKKNNHTFLTKKMFWMNFLDIQRNFSQSLNIVKKGQILGPLLNQKGFYIFRINDFINKKENIATEFYIQHCLIKPSIILSKAESKKKIVSIYKKIKKGIYSFDYAVKNLSDDFYSSNKKGNIGWVSKELFNINFYKKLSCLNMNEISSPIKSKFGWHIVKLLDKRQIDKFYFFKKKEAFNTLLNKQIILEKKHWIEDLKRMSYIKIIK